MSNLEHYFENLLYYGEDIKGEANKNALTEEQQKSVEQCAQYVIYSLFGTREHFDEWINREPASPWHRVEEPPNFSGKVLVWRDVLGDFGDREYTFDTAYYNGLDGGQIPKGTFFKPIPGEMGFRVLDDVTHWARPEPPKEETK